MAEHDARKRAAMRPQERSEPARSARPDPLQTRPAQLRVRHHADLMTAAASRRANRTGLPDRLKDGVEALAGVPLDDVRVHRDSARPAQLEAHAYAQGDEIHLGPGQEAHLPHEAWHVAQQKQGRVRPTGRHRTGTAVNEDPGLEREADAMGAKATAYEAAGATPAAGAPRVAVPVGVGPEVKRLRTETPRRAGRGVVQAYAIEREPKSKELFSVSGDRSTITGMGTPNHDLYVDRPAKLGPINAAAKQSVLNFADGGRTRLFDRSYTRVQVGFKPLNTTWFWQAKKPELDDIYEKEVAPAALEQSREAREDAVAAIAKTPLGTRYRDIADKSRQTVRQLELFKKLAIHNQIGNAGASQASDMEVLTAIVQTIEESLYGSKVTRAEFAEALLTVSWLTEHVSAHVRNDTVFSDAAEALLTAMQELVKLMPEDDTINLMLIHSLNYREAMIESIEKGDPLFYRACDVMAATVMGNNITLGNQMQLKKYQASETAFHYAAKLVSAGDDWVSLESFAASPRERQVIGEDNITGLTNIENTWQYIMYGSLTDDKSSMDRQDKAFEVYTKLRYQLKGIDTRTGSFVARSLDGLKPEPVSPTAFALLFDNKNASSRRVWTRLHEAGILDEAGLLMQSRRLTKDSVSDALDADARSEAETITRMLLEHQRLNDRPRYVPIRPPAYNESRNVVAWFYLLRQDLLRMIPLFNDVFDRAKIVEEFETKIADGFNRGEDPLKAYDESWRWLMEQALKAKSL